MRYWLSFLFLLPFVVQAEQIASVDHGATSVKLRFPLWDSANQNLCATDVTTASTGLEINVSTDVSAGYYDQFTQADSTLEGIAAIGTYVAPPANSARFQIIAAGACIYELQLPDAAFAVADATQLNIEVTDGNAEIIDDYFWVDLNAATATALAAAQASIETNGTLAQLFTPNAISKPLTGSLDYSFRLHVKGATGAMMDADSAPTISTLTNEAGVDRSARLDSTTATKLADGIYEWVYTSSAADDTETLQMQVFVVLDGQTRNIFGHSRVDVLTDTRMAQASMAQLSKVDPNILNCEVNTANFAGSTTTVACILTDRDGGAVTQASGDLTGRFIEVLSGAQIREQRYINSTTWDATNSELQLTLSRALPGILADADTAVIR